MRRATLSLLLLASCTEEKPAPKLETLTTPEGHPRSKLVSTRQSFVPADFLVPGYVTVLKFTAAEDPWNAQVSPLVDQLIARQIRAVLRTVDLGDGKSAAAYQVAMEHRMKEIPLPFFCIYDKNGTLVGKVAGPDLGALDWGIRKALGSN
jgi:hypothetical protein